MLGMVYYLYISLNGGGINGYEKSRFEREEIWC